MASMVYNWDSDEVDAVVVTDGSRVLGLGDLGVGGLGISIGKLDLYVAAGGFHPRYGEENYQSQLYESIF